MNFPKDIEQKLDFTAIRERLSAFCVSPMGQEWVQQIRFHTKAEHITAELGELSEMIYLQQYDRMAGNESIPDARHHLQRLEIEGYYLTEGALHDLRQAMSAYEGFRNFLQKRVETYPLLQKLLITGVNFKTPIARLDEVLDNKGEMKPGASPVFQKLQRESDDISRELDKRLRSIFKKARESGWAAETEVTIREGRLVLPLLAEHKRKIAGFVHDESATGHIHYIEPAEVLELNNRSREIAIERRREIERILRQLTEMLRPIKADLVQMFKALGHYDGLRAKALLALKMNARIPVLSATPAINIQNGVHPLLAEKNTAEGRETIPLSMKLDDENRILVISGPNAGGKSVAMKTAGLLQYMLQCGLAVPVGEGSLFGVFKHIFIDIGDDQNLEQDLSTYSSHLRNMAHFLRHGNRHTLFLMDEFGTGTDPQFGGPIAESILEQLNRKGCFGILTTHYSNLKLLAERTDGMLNASMAYDTEALRPLFKLETGKPGSSFAFEVAQKTGLPRPVIERARKLVGRKQGNVDELILQLEREKNLLEEERNQLRVNRLHYEKLMTEYARLKALIEENKKKIITQAKGEALQIVTKAQKEAEKLIAGMRKAVSENPIPAETVRKTLTTKKEQLKAELEEQEAISETPAELKIGDLVRIKGQEMVAEVVEIQKKKVVLGYGDVRTTVAVNKLEKVEAINREMRKRLAGIDLNAKLAGFSTRLDLRGQRGEEALANLEQWIDSALLSGLSQLSIVHGKGNGILRNLIRTRLRQYPQVKKMHDEHADRGGDGVTVVELA